MAILASSKRGVKMDRRLVSDNEGRKVEMTG